MNTVVAVLLSLVVGYALGSVPWAYLAARSKGLNIGMLDTRIAGAANVYRHVGHVEGVLVFLGDAAKGAAAVVFARIVGLDGSLALIAVGSALLGHAWPLFGRFPGGVALATLAGGAAALGGWMGLIAMVVGAAMVILLRNAGNGSAFGFAAFVLLGLWYGIDPVTVVGVIALGVAVLVWARVLEHRRLTNETQG